ncbi:MAG: glutamine synthetase family protein [Geminicoccaceae bacterium]
MPAALSQLTQKLEETDAQQIDLRFTDLSGGWRHLSFPASSLDEDFWRGGLFFDGSSIAGWREIETSDLMLLPDIERWWSDPFSAQPQLIICCDVGDPVTRSGYERDPRTTLKRALSHMAATGVADQLRVSVDLTLYIGPSDGEAPSEPGQAGSARGQSSSYGGWPQDRWADLRAEIATVLADLGLNHLRHFHAAGPDQIEIQFGPVDALLAADHLQLAKYAARQVANAYGRTAILLPRPFAHRSGSACHLHLSMWKEEKPAFAGNGYADLSDLCGHVIGGILEHGRALNAFTNSRPNSYRRPRDDQNEPTTLAYGVDNRSTALRIPFAADRRDKRVELRFPDPALNPYLTLAALIMAGVDGAERKVDPGDPVDRNLYDFDFADRKDMRRCCTSLESALDSLAGDQGFLLAGDVFSSDLLDTYGQLKRYEIAQVEAVPHPVELSSSQ